MEVADAPEADEYHAEEVLVEHNEVAPDPLRPVVEVARHLAHTPESQFSLRFQLLAELIGSLRLDNVWVFVQLIFGPHWPMNWLNIS